MVGLRSLLQIQQVAPEQIPALPRFPSWRTEKWSGEPSIAIITRPGAQPQQLNSRRPYPMASPRKDNRFVLLSPHWGSTGVRYLSLESAKPALATISISPTSSQC